MWLLLQAAGKDPTSTLMTVIATRWYTRSRLHGDFFTHMSHTTNSQTERKKKKEQGTDRKKCDAIYFNLSAERGREKKVRERERDREMSHSLGEIKSDRQRESGRGNGGDVKIEV